MSPYRPNRFGRIACVCTLVPALAVPTLPAALATEAQSPSSPALPLRAAPPETASAPSRIETLNVVGAATPASPGLDADALTGADADIARALARLPGIAINANGPLSGLIQARGLFGPRVAARLDGLTLVSGGPNWMDPPMHYVPAGLLDSVRLDPGGSALADGPGLATTATAALKGPDYSSDGSWQASLDLDASAHGVDDGWGTAAVAGLADGSHRLHVLASHERGADRRAGDGRVVPTAYERRAEGLGYGWRGDRVSLDLALRRIHSDDAGTPALPLDIAFFDTRLAHADLRVRTGLGEIRAFLGAMDVDHGMNNVEQRTTPDFSSAPLPPFAGPDARRADAEAEGREARLSLIRPLGDGTLDLGLELREERHDVRVTDPDFAPFFVDNFRDAGAVERTVRASWAGSVGPATTLRGGLRLRRTTTSADRVDAFPARLVDANPDAWGPGTPPRGLFMLRERANATDRSREDVTGDWDLRVAHRWNARLRTHLALSRRTRVPAYLERFLWVPLEVNGGLGDGNSYVGDADLRPEVAHGIEAGLVHATRRQRIEVRAHLRRIDDYVQGVAATDPVVIGVSAGASGDPTPLRFANVDARLWGFEVLWRRALGEGLGIEVTGTWLDGARRDIDDGLFRIDPPSLELALSGTLGTLGTGPARGRLAWRLEQRLVARADAGSRTLTLDPANPLNRFADVPGHGLTNLRLDWRGGGPLDVSLGVENLLDRHYVEPTSGFNRTPDGVARIGERLPGPGRNLYARVRYRMN